jgi:hypothetical protein
LTDEERVELAVSASHAIVVGRVLAVRDSIDSEGMLWRWMVLDPVRWLKGNAGRARIPVYFSQITSTGYHKVFSWPNRPLPTCLVFMRRAGDRWRLVEAPDIAGGGVIQLAPKPEGTDEAAAVRGIARQTLESLARRSTLIIVGKTVQTDAICHAHGKSVRCADVVVNSVIVGALPSGPIRVHTLFGGFDSHPHVLLMLRPDGSGGYENVGFGSGTLPINGDRVEALGENLRDLVGRIRQAAAAGETERSKP